MGQPLLFQRDKGSSNVFPSPLGAAVTRLARGHPSRRKGNSSRDIQRDVGVVRCGRGDRGVIQFLAQQ